MTRFVLFALIPALAACQSMQRSPESGYAGLTNQSAGEHRIDSNEAQQVAAELGHRPGQTLDSTQWRQVQERMRLRQLERGLQTRKEKEQYSKILPWFESDAEKVEYLSIPTIEGRQAWINSKDVWKRSSLSGGKFKDTIENGDITVGMAMDHVRKAWGDPLNVEVSGNPLYQNQRWAYQKFVSSPEGYRHEKRFIYFEGGKVVGWETE